MTGGSPPARIRLVALEEIDALLGALRASGDDLTRHEPTILLAPVETPADHDLVRLSESVVAAELGRDVAAGGVPYGTDASHISGLGGIPCVVLGPGSIDQAHTEDEWVASAEVVTASRIYERLVLAFAGAEGAERAA